VVGPGSFRENLTVTGIDLRETLVGDRWRVGSAELEVSEPRFPYFKLGIRMGDRGFRSDSPAPGRLPADRSRRGDWRGR
jgi:MOSC domain-containing protein YiiM